MATPRQQPQVVERAPEVAEFLAGRPPAVVRYAPYLLVAICALIVVTAACIPYPTTVQLPLSEQVAAASRESIVATTEVDIDEVLVADGESVVAGQLLAVSRAGGSDYEEVLYLDDLLYAVPDRPTVREISRLSLPIVRTGTALDAAVVAFNRARSDYSASADTESSLSGRQLAASLDQLERALAKWKGTYTFTARQDGTLRFSRDQPLGVYRSGDEFASVTLAAERRLPTSSVTTPEANLLRTGQSAILLPKETGWTASREQLATTTVVNRNPDGNVTVTYVSKNDTVAGDLAGGRAIITVEQTSLLGAIFSFKQTAPRTAPAPSR